MFKKIIIFLLVCLGTVIVYAGQAEVDESLKAISNLAVRFRYYTLPDNSLNFVKVTGTLPSATSTVVHGVNISITSAGSAANSQFGANISFLGGYTGTGATRGLNVANSAAGTATDIVGNRLGNFGIIGVANGDTAGFNAGVVGLGTNANTSGTGKAFGVVGLANTPSAGVAQQIGVMGIGRSSTSNTGGYFGLTNSNPTIPDAGLVANNGSVSVPIFIGQDNGVNVWTIENGGAVWSAQIKNLTETVVTNIFQLDIASGTSTGAVVNYTVEADDGSDRQERTGRVAVNIVNKAGTETCTIGGFDGTNNPTETKDGSDISTTLGTLTYTWGQSNSPTNGCLFTLNATSSLTQTTLRINYSVHELGNVATVFTPQ